MVSEGFNAFACTRFLMAQLGSLLARVLRLYGISAASEFKRYIGAFGMQDHSVGL